MKGKYIYVSSKWGGVGGILYLTTVKKGKFAHFISDIPLRHLKGRCYINCQSKLSTTLLNQLCSRNLAE
jgi:hypothetical protein